jgi:hypothetical protein
VQTDLRAKKAVRDKARITLTNTQIDFDNSGAVNYDRWSSLIDNVAGGLGKKAPVGKRVLAIRKRLLSASAKVKPPPSASADANNIWQGSASH